jgi:hypothetical protein
MDDNVSGVRRRKAEIPMESRVVLEPPTCDDRLLWDIFASRFFLPALAVADELGLFTILAKSPATPEQLIQYIPLSERGAEVLLGLLASLGFVTQRLGRFHVTETARNYLLPSSPYYYGPFLRMSSARMPSRTAFRELLARDLSNASASSIGVGWASGDCSVGTALAFTEVMHNHSLPAAIGLARHVEMQGITRLLDVGGGSGCFCIALAMRYPNMRFTVLELPSVAKVAEKYITAYQVEDQVGTVAANMFEAEWPRGYDGVLFSNVFHDWDRNRCLQLAQRAFALLDTGGRIFLHEILLNDTKDGPAVAAAFSAGMLGISGKQYSAKECEQILLEIGFEQVSILPTYAYYSVISATKP